MTKAFEYTRRWRLRHPDRYKLSYQKQNAKRTKEHHKINRLKKLARNPRYGANYIRQWRIDHSEQWNVIYARSKRKRYWNSIHHRVKELVSRSILKAVRKNGTIKIAKTLELLGTDIPTFRAWLESKFQDGMNWRNIGKFGWHIDHVIPCSSFDLADEKQQRKCFHYTNLQPLWWRDNLSKGNKIL